MSSPTPSSVVTPETAPAATFTLALIRIVVRQVRQVAGNLANRRAIAKLAHLDERQLKDIGLTRGDIHAALLTPISQDPSMHLASLRPEGASRAVPQPLPEHPRWNRVRRADAPLNATLRQA